MRYGVQGSRNKKNLKVSGGATISELNSSTNYSIEVAAVNSAGTGVYSTAIFIITSGIMSICYLKIHTIGCIILLLFYNSMVNTKILPPWGHNCSI